jgi:hypothetical protein
MTKVQKRLVASAAAIALMAGLFVGIQPIGGRATVGGLDISAEDAIDILDTVKTAEYDMTKLAGPDPQNPLTLKDANGSEVTGIPIDLPTIMSGMNIETTSTDYTRGTVTLPVGGTNLPISFNTTLSQPDGSTVYSGTASTTVNGVVYSWTVTATSTDNGFTYTVGITPGSRPQPEPDPVVVVDTTPSAPSGYVPVYAPTASTPAPDAPAADGETPAADAPAADSAPAADVAATEDGAIDTAAATEFVTEAAAAATEAGETEVVATVDTGVTTITADAITELIASVPEGMEVKLESKVETADGESAGSILIPLAEGMEDVKTGVKPASESAIESTSAALGADFVGAFTTEQKGTFGTEVTFSLKASAFGIDVETDLADCELSEGGYKIVYVVVVSGGEATQVKGLINKNGKIVFRTDLAGTYYVSATPVLK